MKILGWERGEIESLFKEIEAKGGNLMQAFLAHAEKNKRKTFSVRNYYYKLLRLGESEPEVAKFLESMGVKIQKRARGNNIVPFGVENVQARITDEEIHSLFLGLVRLVKRSAEEEREMQNRARFLEMEEKLQSKEIDIRRKEVLIRELHAQNVALKDKLRQNREEIAKEVRNNFYVIDDLCKSKKMENLRAFVAEIAGKSAQKGRGDKV